MCPEEETKDAHVNFKALTTIYVYNNLCFLGFLDLIFFGSESPSTEGNFPHGGSTTLFLAGPLAISSWPCCFSSNLIFRIVTEQSWMMRSPEEYPEPSSVLSSPPERKRVVNFVGEKPNLQQ
mmetsp:Transcript_11254/g.14896  ORF Transcript_11254/g.14896 Transcript_11254/m.14896 type:complete len:122 (+) Transcript_11254:870-1235(+)